MLGKIFGTSNDGGGFKGFSGSLFGGSSSNFGGFEALSKDADAKPSWLTASGSSSTASPWTGAGSTLFSTASPKGDGDDASDEDDGENDPDPQFEPIIPLPSHVEVSYLYRSCMKISFARWVIFLKCYLDRTVKDIFCFQVGIEACR